MVAAAVAGYFALVHGPGAGRAGGKEVLVGLLFAAGWGPTGRRGAGRGRGVVARGGRVRLLCRLNCGLIDRWETAGGPTSRGVWAAGAWAVALTAAGPAPVAAAVAGSVAALAGLHAARHRLGPRAGRVLADVALLTPLAWGIP